MNIEVITLLLSSINRRIDFNLPARFYSRDEVEDLLKQVARIIDRDIFNYIKESEE